MKLRSMNERNLAKEAINDENYERAVAMSLVALYDLIVEILQGKFDEEDGRGSR